MFKSNFSRTILSVAGALVMSATLIGAAIGPATASPLAQHARAL